MIFSKNSALPFAAFALFSSLFLFPPTEASNILFFIGFGGPSHRIAMQPLANALSTRGHKITFVVQQAPKPDNSSNIRYVVARKVAESFASSGGSTSSLFDMRVAGSEPWMTLFFQKFGHQVCENLYADTEFMQWLEASPKFDLVILDALFNECGYGIAHLHGAKTIIFSISSLLPWSLDALGLPDESAWTPDIIYGGPIDMGFSQRVSGAIMPVLWRMYRQWYYLPRMETITKEGLKIEDLPSFSELERNTSLVFLNTHPAQEIPRSLPPNVISVGGMSWVEARKPLPQKLTDFINTGKVGFIYISFGSHVDFLSFPEEIQDAFINALKHFPNIQFIWKLNKTPANLPSHILMEKWLPQQDLLLHPKIRSFITHSGIGGVNEAIYSSVPLICFPLFTEQDVNAQLVQKRGFGIKMEITTLTQKDLVEAISEMITNDRYKENAKKVTKQFVDRPMKPVETAVWYTEFVLRQENTEYLRSFNVDLPWWKKRQLDVWIFILVWTILINTLGIYLASKVYKRFFGSRNCTRKPGAQKLKQK